VGYVWIRAADSAVRDQEERDSGKVQLEDEGYIWAVARYRHHSLHSGMHGSDFTPRLISKAEVFRTLLGDDTLDVSLSCARIPFHRCTITGYGSVYRRPKLIRSGSRGRYRLLSLYSDVSDIWLFVLDRYCTYLQ
jgi:hypothetical protein